jgi:hypothetical protein
MWYAYMMEMDCTYPVWLKTSAAAYIWTLLVAAIMIDPTVIKTTQSTRPSLRPHTSMSLTWMLVGDISSRCYTITNLGEWKSE